MFSIGVPMGICQDMKEIKKIKAKTKSYIAKSKVEKAFSYLNKQIEKYPESDKIVEYAASVALDVPDYELSEMYLTKAHYLNPSDKRVSYSLYQSLKRRHNYPLAKKQLKQCLGLLDKSSSLYESAKREYDNLDIVEALYNNPVDFEPTNLGINVNSKYDEYMPFTSVDGKMIFARLHRQEDLYFTEKLDSTFSLATPLEGVNTMENEGASCISPDGNFIFITKCNAKGGYGGCDIYVSYRSSDGWTKPKNLGKSINTAAKETQPSISPNGKTLYFVSDREGGFGKTDIYKSTYENKMWSTPENLGDQINTFARDESPFIHMDNKTLYFRSVGHPGLGDFDIFMSKKMNEGWGIPKNIGYPINGEGNDGSFFVDVLGKQAYFASNSFEDSFGGLDLYTFEMPEDIRPDPVTYVKLILKDRQSDALLNGEILLVDIDSGMELKNQTNIYNEILHLINPATEYALTATAEGYNFHTEHISVDSSATSAEPYLFTFYLDKIQIESSSIAETEFNKAILLNNIFFESGSYKLLEKSKYEIQTLVDYLMKYPNCKMKIVGHTDNVGSESDNILLSENRASAVKEALIAKGVDGGRLDFQGEGEKMPLYSNETAEGREKNRRTEVVITYE